MTDDAPPDTRAGRILEAVLISAFTAAATQGVEYLAERLKRRRRRKRAKPKQPP